jgi:hypothetical protein
LSCYRTFIELTPEIIAKRTNCYRTLVIVFVSILLLSLCVAILSGGFRSMILLLLFLPAYALFLVCDEHILNHWRCLLLTAWKSKKIDLSALDKAISANKQLPRLTLETMFDTLPQCADLIVEQSYSETLRGAIAETFTLRYDVMCYWLIRNASVHAIVCITIISCVMLWSLVPVMGLLLIPFVALLFSLMKRKRNTKLSTKLDEYRKSDGFDENVFLETTAESTSYAQSGTASMDSL